MDSRRNLPPALAGAVESCVPYDLLTEPGAMHHGLPSPAATVILSFDGGLDCSWPDGTQARRWRVLVAGLHRRPAVIRSRGPMVGVQLALTPTGVRALLGVPAGALGGLMVESADLPGAALHAWLDDLTELDAAARPGVLLRRLARAIGEVPASAPELDEAWRQIRRRSGRVRVDALAAHVGWSRRRLTRSFTSAFGLSPKQAADVARFDHARALVDAGVALADASLRAGYADQAHLTRAWRALAGGPPTETVRESQTFKTFDATGSRIAP